MANNDIIKIGLTSDVQGYIKEIKKELSSVKDWGLADALKAEIDDINKMLDGLSRSFSDGMNSKLDTKRFAGFEKDVASKMKDLDDRVGTLESTMKSLVDTMGLADKSDFQAFLASLENKFNNVNNVAKDTVSTMKELTNIGSKNGASVQFVDKADIDSLEKEKELLNEIIAIANNDKISGAKNLNKNTVLAATQIKEASKKLKEAQNDLDEFNRGKSKDSTKLAELQKEVAMRTTILSNYVSQVKEGFFKKDNPITGELRKQLDAAEKEFLQFAKNAESRLSALKSAKEEVLSTDGSTNSDGLKNITDIKIPVRTDITKEDFWPSVKRIIEYTQKKADTQPIELSFVLNSKMSSKNTNALLKEWQSKIGDIDDEQLRTEFDDLFARLNKDIGKGIKLDIESDFNKEKKNIKEGISEIQEMLGGKISVFPQFKISERQTKKLQTELNKASKALVLPLNHFDINEDAKNALSKTIKESSALRSVVDNLSTKLDSVDANTLPSISKTLNDIFEIVGRIETPVNQITDAIKELVMAMQQLFGATTTVNLEGMFSEMQNSVANIHGKLNAAPGKKNPLVSQLEEIIVAYQRYQKLGGDKLLSDLGGDANIQKWLKKHENDDYSKISSDIVEKYAQGITKAVPKVEQVSSELAETPKETVEEILPQTSTVMEALGEELGTQITEGILKQKTKVKNALKSLVQDGILDLADLSSDNSILSSISGEVYEELIEKINSKTNSSKYKMKAHIPTAKESEANKERWAESLSEVGLNPGYARLDFSALRNLTDIKELKSAYQELNKVFAKVNKEIASDRGSKDLREFVTKISDVISELDKKIEEAENQAAISSRKYVSKKKGSSYYKPSENDPESILSFENWKNLNRLKNPEKRATREQIFKLLQEYVQTSDTELLNSIKEVVSNSTFSKGMKESLIRSMDAELAKVAKMQGEEVAKSAEQSADKYAEGVEEAKPEAKKAAEDLANTAIDTIAETQDSNSPSKVTKKLGEYFGDGYSEGILNSKAKIKNAVRALVEEGVLTLQDLQRDKQNGKGITDAIAEITSGKGLTRGAKEYQKQIHDIEEQVKSFLYVVDMQKGSKAYSGIDNVEQKVVEFTHAIRAGAMDAQSALQQLFSSFDNNKLSQELSSSDYSDDDIRNLGGYGDIIYETDVIKEATEEVVKAKEEVSKPIPLNNIFEVTNAIKAAEDTTLDFFSTLRSKNGVLQNALKDVSFNTETYTDADLIGGYGDLTEVVDATNKAAISSNEIAENIERAANGSFGYMENMKIAENASDGLLKNAIKNKTYNGKNYFEPTVSPTPKDVWNDFISGADKAYTSVHLVNQETQNIGNIDFGKVDIGASFVGALKSQIGDASKDVNSYIETLLNVVDKNIVHRLVKEGDSIVPKEFETYSVNYQKLENELIKSDTKIIELSHKIADATAEEAEPLQRNLDILKEQRSVYQALLDEIVDSDFYAYDQSSLNAFNQRRYQNRNVLANNFQAIDAKKVTQEAEQVAQAYQKIDKAIEKANKTSLESAQNGLSTLGGDKFRRQFIPEIADRISELTGEYQRLVSLGRNGEIIPTADLEKAKIELRALKNEVGDVNNYFAESDKVTNLYSKVANFFTNNTAMSREFKNELKEIMATLKSGQPIVESTFKGLETRFNSITGQVRELGQTGNSLFTAFKKQLKSANAQFLTTYFSLQDWIRYIRQAISTVQELDYALIDLRKTTTMTSSELNEFYYDANETARELGVTTKQIIEQASAWSRLGYSSKDAATEMAALSSQFKQISPGMDLDQATDGLVSTMKAFHIDVADAEREIMDVINKTGNTMATSNDEIVEMLKRSSAAMSAANNSLKETIALESAAVQITRNAETTGTAFRTISMRIRGYDEETEEYIGGIEELTGKIADLTKTAKTPGGITLFTDETKTEYKSTYEILKDISEIYHDLTDKNQAELLETLAGKRGGQVLAGILDDFSEVERAMENMENSAGSADAEMAIVEESIDYKLNRLRETWTGIVQELVDRGYLGQVIDFLTRISEILGVIVENLGVLGTVGAVGGGFAIFKKSNDIATAISQIVALQKSLAGLEGITISSGTAIKTYLIKNLATLVTNPVTWWVVGITAALVAGKVAWDHYNVTVAETEEKITGINQTISELTSEIEELSKIENRTDAQEARLGLLNDELEIQKELLDIAERKRALESTTTESDDWFKQFSDWYDEDNYSTQLRQSQEKFYYRGHFDSRFNQDSAEYDELIAKQRQYNEELQNAEEGSAAWNKASENLASTTEKLAEVENTIKSNYGEVYSEYANVYSSYQELLSMMESFKDDPIIYERLQESAQAYEDYIEILRGYLIKARERLGQDTSDLTVDSRLDEANSHIANNSEEDLDKLTNYTKGFSNEQKEAWIVATQGAHNADEAIQKYEESLKNTIEETQKLSSVNSPILDSVEGISTRLKAQFDELGSAYDSIFNGDNGFDLNVVDNDLLKGIADNFVTSAVESELLSQDEATAAAERFMKVLTDQTTTAEEAQQAFNDLATSYFYSADGLKELNEENADAIKQQLKQMGVQNAEEVVDVYLNPRSFDSIKNQVGEQMKELEKGGGVDLLLRPKVDAAELNKVGWEAGEGVATVFSSTFSNEAGTVAINFTPILTDENGKKKGILSPDGLEAYAEGVINGVHDDYLNLQIGAKFEGKDAINQAVKSAEKIHELQDVYYNLEEILADVDEANTKDIETQLEQLGVTNAHALVVQELEANKAKLAIQEKVAAGASYEEAAALLTESNASEYARIAAYQLAVQEGVLNNTSLDFSGKIAELTNLASAYLTTANAAKVAAYAQTLESGVKYGGVSSADATAKLNDYINNLSTSLDFEKIKVDFGSVGGGKDAASSAGGEAGDAYVEAYEKELQQLDDLKSQGLISEREYLDRLKALIDKYFKGRAKYAEKYAQELQKYMDQMLTHYNSVISGATTLLDKRINQVSKQKDSIISALEAEKETAEEAYQAQIDAIQEEIDALDDLIEKKQEEIDGLNDQIDAINEANDARDRSINLQKAEYELQRMMNQRTKLVYTGGAGGNQMRYERDESGVREAQENLKDAQDDIAIAAIEKQIKLIEDEIEAIEKQKKALQDQQEELQKAMEATSKYYEKLIKEQEKMFDDMIEALENTKSKWEELAEVDQIASAWGLVSDEMQALGFTIDDVLNGNSAAFEAFKNQYINHLAAMHSGDQGYLDGLKNTVGQAPIEYKKLEDAATNAEQPISKLGDSAGTASGKVSSLGTSASTASTGVDELKKASEGIDESLSKVEQVDFTELKAKLGDVTSDIQKAIDLIGDETKTVSLYGALNSLNTLTFDGLITSFMLLKNAVSGVLSALTGAVGSSDTSAIAAGAVAGAAVVTGGESGGGLVGALKDAQDTASSTIGTGGEVGANDDGTASTESDGTVIGDFLALGGAITNATTAIGTTESEADAGDLIGSLLSLGETDTNVLQGGDQGQGVIRDWQDFNVELSEAEEHVTKMAEGLENLADSYETTLTVNLVINGEGEYTGTAKRGKSSGVWSVNVLDAIGLPSKSGDWMSSLSKNAKGTAKIPARFAGEWGYQGGKTLIAELGPELVVFPDGHAQTFDHPQIVDLPRGSVIFNHLQSQEILDPNNQIKPGSVHAAGSALPSGFTPWVEDSKINTLKAKIAEIGIPTIDGIKSALRAQTEAIRSEVRNAVSNNSSAETTVNQHNTFNISGVSGEDVARQINTTLVNTFSGMSLNAYQRSMA